MIGVFTNGKPMPGISNKQEGWGKFNKRIRSNDGMV